MERRVAKGEQLKSYYGWVIVTAVAVIYAIMSGTMSSFSNFIKPISESLDWSRTSVTLAIGFQVIIGGIFAVPMGYLCDRAGPKLVTVIGGVSLTIGFFLTSRMLSPWQFYVFYSLFGGIAFACVYVPLTATVSKWFSTRRGLALGLFYGGGGIGGLILSPFVNSQIISHGWRHAWLVLAIITACVVIPLAFLLRRPPEPLAADEVGGFANAEVAFGAERTSPQDYTLIQALKTKFIWLLCCAAMLTFTGLLLAHTNMVPFATDQDISETVAATALGVMAAVDSAGRVVTGFVSDRAGSRRPLLFCVFVAAATLFFLILANSPWMIFAFAVVSGFVYGGLFTLLPRLVAENFGTRSMGAIMGVCAIFVSVGPAMGPAIGALVYDQTGDYSLAFLGSGLGIMVAFVVFLLILPRRPSPSGA